MKSNLYPSRATWLDESAMFHAKLQAARYNPYKLAHWMDLAGVA